MSSSVVSILSSSFHLVLEKPWYQTTQNREGGNWWKLPERERERETKKFAIRWTVSLHIFLLEDAVWRMVRSPWLRAFNDKSLPVTFAVRKAVNMNINLLDSNATHFGRHLYRKNENRQIQAFIHTYIHTRYAVTLNTRQFIQVLIPQSMQL